MPKKFLILSLLFLLVGLAVGLAIGRTLPRTSGWPALNFGSQAGQTAKITSLTGQALAVNDKSLLFKTRIRQGDNLLAVQKEAQTNAATAIYLLTPKTIDDIFTADYNTKLISLSDQLKRAQAQKNTAAGKKLLDQVRALTAEANQAKLQAIKDLEAKIANLPDNSPDKQGLTAQLEQLNSNFKYSPLALADIKPGAVVEVWSNEDLSAVDKFTATKIEVRQ
jgi:hypothetical protein